MKLEPLDVLFSEYVRRRSNGYCERCGKYYGWKGLQCAHFHSRRKKSVRWDEDNACALDCGCHRYLDDNAVEKVEFFLKRLGQERYDMLAGRMRQTHPKPDKVAITLYLQAKITERG